MDSGVVISKKKIRFELVDMLITEPHYLIN